MTWVIQKSVPLMCENVLLQYRRLAYGITSQASVICHRQLIGSRVVTQRYKNSILHTYRVKNLSFSRQSARSVSQCHQVHALSCRTCHGKWLHKKPDRVTGKCRISPNLPYQTQPNAQQPASCLCEDKMMREVKKSDKLQEAEMGRRL